MFQYAYIRVYNKCGTPNFLSLTLQMLSFLPGVAQWHAAEAGDGAEPAQGGPRFSYLAMHPTQLPWCYPC